MEANQHSHDHSHDEKPMSQEDVVKSLLYLGEIAVNAGDYESAATAYASVLQLRQDVTALYNLASFYARGLGCRQNYLEAARLFHQAELLGNERAGKLCKKCMMDFIDAELPGKTSVEIYAAMSVFVSMVYPEANDKKLEVNNGLFSVAATHYNRGERDQAVQIFRAAAELGNDAQAQYYLDALQ